jgi:hypothetical protein
LFKAGQKWLELSGLNEVLISAKNINCTGDNINASKNNAEIHLQGCKAIGLEVNINGTKYMHITQSQNQQQYHKTATCKVRDEIGNKPYDNKYGCILGCCAV